MVKRKFPANKMLVEAATGARFVVNDDPLQKIPVVTEYVRLPDWTAPRTWGEFRPEGLDNHAMKAYWPAWEKATRSHGAALLGMDQNLKILKAMNRKYFEDEQGNIGSPGGIRWVTFHHSPSMWVVVHHPNEGHWLLFDDQYRSLGGKERVAGQGLGVTKTTPPKPRGNTWGD